MFARIFLLISSICVVFFFFFFNDTATTEIYTLSLHDALPIFAGDDDPNRSRLRHFAGEYPSEDRKSTRLNSSHTVISYAVFCLKKKKNHPNLTRPYQCRNFAASGEFYLAFLGYCLYY